MTYTGNGDGRRSGFNNLGQIAFEAEFTDGTSGIFVYSLLTIPEPTSISLFGIAMMLIARRRRT